MATVRRGEWGLIEQMNAALGELTNSRGRIEGT